LFKPREWHPIYRWHHLRHWLYTKRHPTAPWLTPTANEMLETLLRPHDAGLEFGSGHSTLWFAKRIQSLTSVEHDRAWYDSVSRLLSTNGVSNTTYLCREPLDEFSTSPSDYTEVAARFEPRSVDFVLVDGMQRARCAMDALGILAPGGLLVIDDAQRYLPSHSSTALVGRSVKRPASALWSEFWEQVSGWRRIWTTSGDSDTLVFFKPS